LEGVRAAWADAGIKNFISEKKGTIHLSQIVVPQAERGSGKGTAAMQQLLDYADRTGQRIVLSPSADFGGNKARLVDFYKKQGFVENKGRNKDFEISESMYREPAQLRASAGRTVEVDGVRRPITNSRGKLVGQGFKEQTAFWKWFGDSKAVDEHGRPIVLYHGTDVAEQFGEFAPGSFFTTAPREASAYARPGDFARRQVAAGKYVVAEGIAHAGEMIPYYGSISEIPDPAIGKVYATDNGVFRALGKGKWEVFSDLLVDYDKSKGDDISVVAGDFSEEAHSVVTEYDNFVRESFPGGDGGRVVPAYVSLKNPVRLNALEANRLGLRLGATRESIQAAIDKYEQLGHDGIVTESDEASMFSDMADDLGGVPAQYIVFRPQQVKSATGNAGTFDGTNPDITASTSAAASAMDTSVAGMIQEGTSVKAVLAEIAARSSDKNFQALATALQAQNLKTGLLFERAQGTYSAGVDASMATASYRASTDTAYLHQAEGAEQNVLHELVHAATLKALAKGGLAATQIRALWSHVRAMPNFKNEYGIVNEEEFVAEAYTSPRFRQMLADTRTRCETVAVAEVRRRGQDPAGPTGRGRLGAGPRDDGRTGADGREPRRSASRC
jgi:predicted GNAT family acetyltransferase